MEVDDTGGGEAILVVEDDAALRALICTTLKACGYEILVASTGLEALMVAQRWPGRLALMISDVTLVGMSGLELASRLRKGMGGLKVLLISGYGRGDLPADLEARGLLFLEKPFGPRALVQTVRYLLAATRGEPAES